MYPLLQHQILHSGKHEKNTAIYLHSASPNTFFNASLNHDGRHIGCKQFGK